ncbi:AAA family ATPase [bacterium]|nr:AAA family ATPase [bacterium]
MAVNPFTPGRTVDPQFFAGRESEIDRFTMFLKSTRDGNPMNLAVLGERGIGKSSLLRKCESLAKKERCVVVRIDLDASVDSIDSLIYQILTGIKKEGSLYSKLFSLSEKIRSFFDEYQASIGLLGSSLQATKKVATSSLQARDELKRIWDNISQDVPAVIIMMDEAEQLEEIEGILQFLRNIFGRLSEERCGYMLILSGKLTLFKQIKKIHSPLARFFNPITLKELTGEESIEAIDKPLSDSPYKMTPEVKDLIADESEGHPYIIQLFGYYLCENAVKANINKEVYKACFPMILDGLAGQLFEDFYRSASSAEQQVLRIIAQSKDRVLTVSDIAEKMGKESKQITYIFNRLYEKDCLRKINRGKYMLFHGLFREYLKKCDPAIS